MMNKKGVSPVIATVLLIVITVILGAIVFVWANGFFKEGLSKNGEPVENTCDLISFKAQYVSDLAKKVVQVDNLANVPLFGFEIKSSGSGSENVEKDLSATLGLGESTEIDVSDIVAGGGIDTLTLVPIILGQRGEATEPFVCPESAGQKVQIT